MIKVLMMLLVAIMGSSVLADKEKVPSIEKFPFLRESRQNNGEPSSSLDDTAGMYKV